MSAILSTNQISFQEEGAFWYVQSSVIWTNAECNETAKKKCFSRQVERSRSWTLASKNNFECHSFLPVKGCILCSTMSCYLNERQLIMFHQKRMQRNRHEVSLAPSFAHHFMSIDIGEQPNAMRLRDRQQMYLAPGITCISWALTSESGLGSRWVVSTSQYLHVGRHQPVGVVLKHLMSSFARAKHRIA